MAVPPYFSCAKCGYRGICKPEEHECAADRVVAAERQRVLPSMPEHARMTAFHAANAIAAVADDDPMIRAVIADQVDRVADPTEIPGESQAARLSRDISGILDRAVGVVYVHRAHDGVGTYNIHQRCDACRDVITVDNVRGDRTYMTTGVAIARATRLAWMKHRCTPIGGALGLLETDDLRQLYEQLERDSERLAARAIEVQRVLDERLAKERG